MRQQRIVDDGGETPDEEEAGEKRQGRPIGGIREYRGVLETIQASRRFHGMVSLEFRVARNRLAGYYV